MTDPAEEADYSASPWPAAAAAVPRLLRPPLPPLRGTPNRWNRTRSNRTLPSHRSQPLRRLLAFPSLLPPALPLPAEARPPCTPTPSSSLPSSDDCRGGRWRWSGRGRVQKREGGVRGNLGSVGGRWSRCGGGGSGERQRCRQRSRLRRVGTLRVAPPSPQSTAGRTLRTWSSEEKENRSRRSHRDSQRGTPLLPSPPRSPAGTAGLPNRHRRHRWYLENRSHP